MSPTSMNPAVVHWRFAGSGRGVPPADAAEAWLAPEEQARARSFRVAKRRNDWLLGRANLKALVAELVMARTGLELAPREVVVERQPSGAPAIALDRATPDLPRNARGRLPLCVSNSHSNGHALAGAMWLDQAALNGHQAAIGVDLEWIEPRSDGFIRDFLTPEEQQLCFASTGRERDLKANLVWSAKESVLKVLQRGLSADTWWLTCVPTNDDPDVMTLSPDVAPWSPFRVSCDHRLDAGQISVCGRWCEREGFVLTVALGRSGPP